MKIAILYNDNEIAVEFSVDKFKELLKLYLNETNDIDISFEKIIKELKKQLINK